MSRRRRRSYVLRAVKGAGGSPGLTVFPDPEAVVDLDFINARYWWNGATRTTADFTTYALNGATFGPDGLTPTVTTDIKLTVSGFWSQPGAMVVRCYPTANAAVLGGAANLSDGTDNNRIQIAQDTSLARIRVDCVAGGGTNAAIILTGTLNQTTGCATSFATNDVRYYRDGVAGTPDVSVALPSPTILRIARLEGAYHFIGAVGRVALYDNPQNDAWLLGRSNQAKALAATATVPFPDPEGVVDLDFVNQRYWWNGATRTTGDFTTYVLNGSTFDANGLTPTATIDVSINISAFWTMPGAFAARLFPTANPGSAGATAFVLSDGTDTNSIRIDQNVGTAQHRCIVTATSAQAAIAVNGTLSVTTGIAASFATNDVRMYRDAVAGTPDTVATMPAVTILKIGKLNAAGFQYLGAIGRVVLYDNVQVDAWLLDRSNRIKA